jgi:ATP-dependent RNA helicase DDX10/DBP4
MAASGTKGALAHRNKPAPKKAESKSLKRKRGLEDLGKLRDAVNQLVSWPLSPVTFNGFVACA